MSSSTKCMRELHMSTSSWPSLETRSDPGRFKRTSARPIIRKQLTLDSSSRSSSCQLHWMERSFQDTLTLAPFSQPRAEPSPSGRSFSNKPMKKWRRGMSWRRTRRPPVDVLGTMHRQSQGGSRVIIISIKGSRRRARTQTLLLSIHTMIPSFIPMTASQTGQAPSILLFLPNYSHFSYLLGHTQDEAQSLEAG
jgi:hypothetical protein